MYLHIIEDHDQYIEHTKAWIQEFVIGHNLCPFAKVPFTQNKIYYSVNPSTNQKSILENFYVVIQKMKQEKQSEISNAFYILPYINLSFRNYLDLFDVAEQLLESIGDDVYFQLVSFHPDYQYGNTDIGDPINLTNRSPYPMIHILRVDEVTAATENYNIGEILENNKKRLSAYRT